MKELLKEIRKCEICAAHLPLGPNPILMVHRDSRVAIIGQAPGTKVHASGIPWDDSSGKQLRKWMGVEDEEFYNEKLFAIVPMGFCYPGKGNTGDLPPRKECAPQWHDLIWEKTKDIKLIMLIGQYAQKHYLPGNSKLNLTETVQRFEDYLPKYIPLPHPSPRNRFWLTKNPWFDELVLPKLRELIREIIA